MSKCTFLSFAALCIGGAAVLVPRAAAGGEHWGGSVAVTTDYRLRGISQSDGSPAVQFDLHYDSNSGWLAGLWASTVKRDRYQTTGGEIDALLGYRWRVGNDWSAKLVAVHYAYPWEPSDVASDYDELVGGLAYRDRAFLTVAYAPDALSFPAASYRGRASALSYELALRLPVARGWSAAGGFGRYQLDDRLQSAYWYWSGGFGYGRGQLHFDLTYFENSDAARTLYYGDAAASRWAGTVTWSF